MNYTFVLYSKTYNKICIGQTENLDKRLYEHNNGLLSGYTKKFKPWKIIYSEQYVTRREALVREKQLKSQKGREFIWRIVKEKGPLLRKQNYLTEEPKLPEIT